MARALGSRRQPTVRVWLCRLDRISRVARDRKSTRLNSSHSQISYAEFCLKKTDLDRHEVVRERGAERGDHPQEHQETVRRDELVVLIWLKEGIRRDGELKAEGKRENPRRDEEVEGREQVENPDILVVRREEPPFQGNPGDHGWLLSPRCTICGNCPR